MRQAKFFAPVLLVMVLTTWASALGRSEDIIRPSEMQPRLQYTGFSVSRPPNDAWFALEKEQGHYTAVFRRKCPTYSHTFMVSIRFKELQRQPSSLQDLEEMVRPFHRFADTKRFEAKDLALTTRLRQGQWCVDFKERIIDHQAPNSARKDLVGRATGFYCLHPSQEKIVIFADCSERGLESELSEELMKEGEKILGSVQLESSPGNPI